MAETTGYNLLAAAAESLRGVEIFSIEDRLTDDQIAHYLSANKLALDQAREAVRQPCVVSIEYDGAYFARHVEVLPLFRNLARSFRLVLEYALRQRDSRGVRATVMDLFQLARASRRRGMIVDFQLSQAYEGMALRDPRRMLDTLISSDATGLANELLQVDSGRESVAEIVTRDCDWVERILDQKRAAGIPEAHCRSIVTDDKDAATQNLMRDIEAMAAEYGTWTCEQKIAFYEPFSWRIDALRKLFAIEAALRAYHARHEFYPRRLHDLVPDFIATIPIDPFRKADFVYRKLPDGYAVYSPAYGLDFGGKPGDWVIVLSGQADFVLDIYEYDAAAV